MLPYAGVQEYVWDFSCVCESLTYLYVDVHRTDSHSCKLRFECLPCWYWPFVLTASIFTLVSDKLSLIQRLLIFPTKNTSKNINQSSCVIYFHGDEINFPLQQEFHHEQQPKVHSSYNLHNKMFLYNITYFNLFINMYWITQSSVLKSKVKYTLYQ